MKRHAVRHVLTMIVAAATLVSSAVVAVPSRAAVIGNFTFGPSSGTDDVVMILDTSGPCLGGTNFQVFVTGPGLPPSGVPVTDNAVLNSLSPNAQGGFSIPLNQSMKAVALAQSPTATLAGTYQFSGRCMDADGSTVSDTFAGSVDFTQNGAAAATYVAKVEVVFGYSTATALSASPAGPVDAGVPVTFTAHVSSSPTNGAIGAVQLMDGGNAVGGATTVDGAGNASISTSFAAAGNHSVTAVFTGAFAFVTGSTSLPLVIGVASSPADATATSLAISPSSASAADMVTLTASVADLPHAARRPPGTVRFTDAGVAVGGVVAVAADRTATLSRRFGEGAHSFAASFVPTDSTVFAPSSSTSQAYTVTHAQGVPQTIETTIDPGSLTISVADTSTVVLPSPVLNATATFLTTTGALHPVTIADTRAGNPGWTLSGQVRDFSTASAAVIPGVDLGWSPHVVDKSAGEFVVPGPAVAPAGPPLVVDPAHPGPDGLHVSRMLASAGAGSGTGTAHVGAELTLDVPTTVPAGAYTATLTLTAI